MYRIILVVSAILVVFTMMPGCSSSESPPPGPGGADEIAEALIMAYDANDYDAYLKYFDANKDGAVAEDYFSQTSKIIAARIGRYVPNSKVIQETKPNGNLTDVYYKAQYSNDSDVTVILTISITDSGTYAKGVWFNSPKLFASH